MESSSVEGTKEDQDPVASQKPREGGVGVGGRMGVCHREGGGFLLTSSSPLTSGRRKWMRKG